MDTHVLTRRASPPGPRPAERRPGSARPARHPGDLARTGLGSVLPGTGSLMLVSRAPVGVGAVLIRADRPHDAS